MANFRIGGRAVHRIRHQFGIDMRAEQAIWRNGTGHVSKDVILAVGVSHHRKQRRVRRYNVVRLHEGLLRDLPVAPQLFGNMRGLVAAFKGNWFKMPVDIAQKLLQRPGLVIRVYEHESPPATHLHRRKTVRFGTDRREVPLARHFLQCSVEFPGPAMKRTAELMQA